MSIIIQNVSKKYGSGVQDYELRINRKVIARFRHVYENGLAQCLRNAAAAAADPRRQEVLDEENLLRETINAIGGRRTSSPTNK